MKRKLFGNTIYINCNYCNNFVHEDGYYCDKNREIRNEKCRKFDYNPLLRVPNNEPVMMQFSKEDFVL